MRRFSSDVCARHHCCSTIRKFARELPLELHIVDELPGLGESRFVAIRSEGRQVVNHRAPFEAGRVFEQNDWHIDRGKQPFDLLLARMPVPVTLRD